MLLREIGVYRKGGDNQSGRLKDVVDQGLMTLALASTARLSDIDRAPVVEINQDLLKI